MEEEIKKLNPKQELFCKLYATEREFFGNGTQAYIEAYQPDQTKKNWYQTARASAFQLLTYPYICERINGLFEEGGMTNEFVDKQLLFLLTQHADFSAKIKAIQEYNKLKKRIETRIKHSGSITLPQPILNVQPDNSDKKDSANEQESQDSTRGNIGQQDNIDSAVSDSNGTVRQSTNSNEHRI